MKYPTILLIAGLAFFLLAELGSMAQLRIIAVTLLIAGAAGMGMLAGGAPPSRLAARAAGLLRSSAAAIAVLLAAPTLLALALPLWQVLRTSLPPADAHPGWGIAGTLTAVLLLAAAVTALGVALRAIRPAASGSKANEAP